MYIYNLNLVILDFHSQNFTMKFIIGYVNITAVFPSYEFAMHKKGIDYTKNYGF